MLEINKNKIIWGFWQKCWIYKIDGYCLLLRSSLSYDTKYLVISVNKIKATNERLIGNPCSKKTEKTFYYSLKDKDQDIKDYLKQSIEEYLTKED